MRIRVLGQNMPVSLGVLALAEALIAALALYAAVCIRFETPISHLPLLENELGPLRPRAPAPRRAARAGARCRGRRP